jgi:hypothetical protein
MKTNLKPNLFIAIFVATALACTTLTEMTDTGDAPAGDILFEDDFSYVLSGWDRASDTDGSTDYSDGGYEIAIYRDDFTAWATPSETFTDTDIEVDTTFSAGGVDSIFGIICRHVDIENFYAMVISSDGYYGILKYIKGNPFVLIGSEFLEFSDSILQGKQTNRLRAVCDGSRLAFYVNGELLLEVNDTDLSSGDAGIIAGTITASSVTVLFDNFIIRQP